MRCSEATRHLQLYIDSQLTLDQVRALEAHLARCAACRNEWLLLEEVASTLGDLKPVAEPADLLTQPGTQFFRGHAAQGGWP